MVRISNLGAGAVTTFSQCLDDIVLKDSLAQQFLQARVLRLKVLQPLGSGNTDASKLAASWVVGGLDEAVVAVQMLDRNAGLRFAQEANDLFVGKVLRHVSSWRVGLQNFGLLSLWRTSVGHDLIG